MTAAANVAALDAALALAAEGLCCFPCRNDKAPACLRGFKAATRDAGELQALWHRFPGPLVGIATGALSDIDALDIDAPRHAAAAVWWERHRDYLPPTRIQGTRSGGLHLLFRHHPALRCWVGRPVLGIDGRGDGGYIIHWVAAGLPLISHLPPAPWPEWLVDEIVPPPAQRPLSTWETPMGRPGFCGGSRYSIAALRDATLRVASAPVGRTQRFA
jgi:hypothetical protein